MELEKQHQRRRSEFRKLVEEQEKSGLTQKEFCSQKGLVQSQFVYYRCIFKKENVFPVRKNPSFSPVRLVGPEKTLVSGEIRILLPNGFSCQFPDATAPERMRQVIEVLLSC